jgi:hypothetical protein
VRARFSSELWEYDEGGWHFLSVPLDLSDEIRDHAGARLRGFGSVRVRATVGPSTWETSLFPSKGGHYLLPVKKPVRRAAGLEAGDAVDVDLEVIEAAAPARRSAPSRGSA